MLKQIPSRLSRPSLCILTCVLGSSLTLVSCTDSVAPPENKMPPTVFDSTPGAPRADSVKIASFIYTMERKFKREAIRNPIDLHFVENGEGMKVVVTYDRKSDPTLAASIADAAVEHAKRLKREDPEMRDVNLVIDREVSARP